MESLDAIKMLNERLNSLLADEQPGLATWWTAVENTARGLAEAAGFRVVRP